MSLEPAAIVGPERPDRPRKRWPAVRAILHAVTDPLRLPPGLPLCFCQACGRDRIVVIERSSYGDGIGMVRVRCAECGTRRHIVASCRQIESLVALQAQQREAMSDELEEFDTARLLAEIAALSAAPDDCGKPESADVHAPDGARRSRWQHR